MPKVSKFTNANGVRKISGLFRENGRCIEDRDNAIYTLKNYDYKHHLSLYRLYMEENDPKEYNFATKYLYDFEHWAMLCEREWFKPHVERWRTELELKIKSQALAHLIKAASEPTREGLSAARFLLEKGWVQTDKPTKGRPTKQQISDSANQIAQDKTDLNDHMTRLGLIDKFDTAKSLKN